MAECQVLIAKCGKGQAGRKIPAGSFPFQCVLVNAGGTGVSTWTLGKCDAKYPSALPSLAAAASGMPEDSGGRKLVLHYRACPGLKRCTRNAGSPNDQSYFTAFWMAASAKGAMILYPASLGCSPSSARSFFRRPLSSTTEEK